MKYNVVIWSDLRPVRWYETNSRSAMKAANRFGRFERGEVVQVQNKHGRVISEVHYSPEDGGMYYRVLTEDDFVALGRW